MSDRPIRHPQEIQAELQRAVARGGHLRPGTSAARAVVRLTSELERSLQEWIPSGRPITEFSQEPASTERSRSPVERPVRRPPTPPEPPAGHRASSSDTASGSSSAPVRLSAAPPTPPPPKRQVQRTPAYTAFLIQESSAEAAAQRFLNFFDTSGAAQLAIFDFNGVLNIDQSETISVINRLRSKGVQIGILSYSRSPDTIEDTVHYVERICAQSRVSIPIVIAPRPIRCLCKFPNDWSKSDFLWYLPYSADLQAVFVDDRQDIVRECQQVVTSAYLRVICCASGVHNAISQWSVPEKGRHFIDFSDVRIVRYDP